MNHKANKLILHFGLAKTGTSALQHALFNHRDELLKHHNTLYPGKYENHFFFQAMFTKQPEKLYQIQRLMLKSDETVTGFLEEYRQSVLTEINEFKPSQIIISSEYFSGMSIDELKAFRSFLETIAKDIILFAYVRDPWSYAVSLFQEMIRSGYLKKEAKIGYAKANVEIFAKFEHAFGKRATILPYESHSNGYDVVKDFCQRFGLNSLLTHTRNYKEVNRGMSREAACVMLQLNQLYPTFDENMNFIPDPARDWMAEAIQNSQLSATPLRISTSTAKLIYEKSKANIEFIEDQYFEGRKYFTEKYNTLKTADFDDTLSISAFNLEQLSEYLLSCMHTLAERAVFSHKESLKLKQDLLDLLEIKNSKAWKILLFFRRVRARFGTNKR